MAGERPTAREEPAEADGFREHLERAREIQPLDAGIGEERDANRARRRSGASHDPSLAGAVHVRKDIDPTIQDIAIDRSSTPGVRACNDARRIRQANWVP